MLKTREMIQKNEMVVRFAEHFATKTSIKNLLKKVPNAKILTPLFENPKYGKEILEYSNLTEQFDIVLSDVFAVYTAKVVAWKANNNNPGMVAKVELFKELISERMEKRPGKEIAGTLGDFMKSATGKEIDKVLVEADIEEDSDMYLQMLVLIATRAFINNAMVQVDTIGIDSAAHATTTQKTTEVVVVDEPRRTLPPEAEKIWNMVVDMKSNVSDDDIKEFISIVRPYISTVIDTFKTVLDDDKFHLSNETRRSSIARKIISENRNLTDTDEHLIGFICESMGTDDSVIGRSVFYVIRDVMNNPSSDSLNEDIKFLIRFVKTDENYNGFLEELIEQSTRINNLAKGVVEEPIQHTEVAVPTIVSHQEAPVDEESTVEGTPVVDSGYTYNPNRSEVYNATRALASAIGGFSVGLMSRRR